MEKKVEEGFFFFEASCVHFFRFFDPGKNKTRKKGSTRARLAVSFRALSLSLCLFPFLFRSQESRLTSRETTLIIIIIIVHTSKKKSFDEGKKKRASHPFSSLLFSLSFSLPLFLSPSYLSRRGATRRWSRSCWRRGLPGAQTGCRAASRAARRAPPRTRGTPPSPGARF